MGLRDEYKEVHAAYLQEKKYNASMAEAILRLEDELAAARAEISRIRAESTRITDLHAVQKSVMDLAVDDMNRELSDLRDRNHELEAKLSGYSVGN